MTKIIPYERNQYALWYDEEPDFKTPTSNEHCLEGDRLLREGKYKEAVQSYLHGAYKEDPESLCSLGMCYEFELGVKRILIRQCIIIWRHPDWDIYQQKTCCAVC